MEIVENAVKPPGKCIVTGDIDGPFIDTGCYAGEIDPYVYLHVPYVEQAARELLGMVSKEEVEKLKADLAEMAAKIGPLQEFVDAHGALDEAAAKLAGTEEPAEEVAA